MEAKLAAAVGASRDALSGKTSAEERSEKLAEELREALEAWDEARGEATARARELSDARASLADVEKRVAAVREVYGEMSVLAYQSMFPYGAVWWRLGFSLTPRTMIRLTGRRAWL